MSRYIPAKTKKAILKRQSSKCNNTPDSNLYNLDNFECPLWTHPIFRGSFPDSIYEFDHIIEWSISHDNSEANLQALCPYCHSVKSRNFAKVKKQLIEDNIIHTKRKSISDNFLVKFSTFMKDICVEDFNSTASFYELYNLFCDCNQISQKRKERKIDVVLSFIETLGYDIGYQDDILVIVGLAFIT